jgi:hypothetical protein
MEETGKKPIPKTQREISLSLQEPYDTTRGNPNDLSFDIKERANQISFRNDTVKPFNLGIQDLDEAIFYYFENIIKPTIIQNGTVQKVPLIYGSSERWKQIQKEGFYRDKNSKIMMPLIVFKRKDLIKDRTVSNKLDANYPYNIHIQSKTYTKENMYDKFNLLNNRKPKKEQYAVIIPDYVTVNYDFVVTTYYVEQMNKIVEAINYASDSYWGNPERFKFRARIDSISNSIEVPIGGERIVKSTFSLTMRGYIISDSIQRNLLAPTKIPYKSKIIFTGESTNNINDI